MKAKFLYKKFWQDCRAAREQRGWSRAAVGKELGVGGSAVAKWEANKLMREDMWRIMAMCVLYDFDVYNYYEVKERPTLKQKRLIEDKTLTRYEPKQGYDIEYNEALDYEFIAWDHVRHAPDGTPEVFHTEIGWVADPRYVVVS